MIFLLNRTESMRLPGAQMSCVWRAESSSGGLVSPVNEHLVVQIDRWERVFFVPVVLRVGPFRPVAAFQGILQFCGDVVSDLAAGLVGGLGMVPSGNIGVDAALFEAVHGTAPDIAGKGLANPTALLLSSVMMLNHLGQRDVARKIKGALLHVYRDRDRLTRDVGGTATLAQFTQGVIEALDRI